MDLPLGESGAVYTNPDGSRSSIVYSSDFLVTTYEDIDDGLKKNKQNRRNWKIQHYRWSVGY